MPLPIAGGGPTRPPTHTPLDMGKLVRLAAELEQAVEDAGHEKLDAAIVAELADEIGAPEAHVYAAATMTALVFDESAPLRFEVCAGGCQAYGAIGVIERLVRLRGEHDFGIVAKRCLDRCDRAAVVLVHTPAGTAGLAHATAESVEEALAQATA
jgi:NADH:ubiquinone oxidoreductase subunit E